MADRVFQEFYCTVSGGGCGGYILVLLNMALNGIVEVVCPKCGHKHQRVIKQGVLCDYERYSGIPTQEICPTIAAWSKEPHHPESKRCINKWDKERKAVVFSENFLADRKFELWGNSR